MKKVFNIVTVLVIVIGLLIAGYFVYDKYWKSDEQQSNEQQTDNSDIVTKIDLSETEIVI